MKHIHSYLFAAFLLPAFLAAALAGPAFARPMQQEEPPGLTTPEELETFVDGLAAAVMPSYHVAGMTVSVVKDGELFFAKGYGSADLEAGVPVRADETAFRAGSVSKLFLWTALMQLVEAGQVDLNADVETYLDFDLPDTYEQPITVYNLLTHTPGFEDRGEGVFVREAGQVLPLGEYLREYMPQRVYPPGEIAAYSNYGAALAGYIVERVSGMPFADYVEQNIFEPLGMARSTFRQPPPPEIRANLSQGYLYSGGAYQEGIFEFVPPYPAGSLSTTATDMAAFMIAHLQEGRYRDTRILEEETARAMHALQFSHDPNLAGYGLGFFVNDQGGLRLVSHGGDTFYFHSELTLIPEHQAGLFVSTNTTTGSLARFNFTQAFLDRYYPAEEPAEAPPPPGFDERAPAYTGTYFPARMNLSSVEKIATLFQPVVVRAGGDPGELAVTGLLGPEPTYWQEREPYVFAPAGQDLLIPGPLVFQAPEDGQGGALFFSTNAYFKQPWYAQQGFQFLLIGLALIFFLGTILLVPVTAGAHRHYRREAPKAIPATLAAARAARWTAWFFAVLNLAFLLVLALTLSDIGNVIFGLPDWLAALFFVPWLAAVLAAALVVFAVLAWARGWWTVWGRLLYTLLALLSAGYVWFLWYWNLLG